MNHFHRFFCFLLFILGACEPALDSQEFGDDGMARRKLENTPVMAPHQLTPVAPVIPSNGSWTGNNQLGIELPFAPDSNNRQTILKLDEWGPPDVWTISLFTRDDLQVFQALGIKATIEFGAG